MYPIYGIDLGTTYTKCAIVRPTDAVVEVFKLDRDRLDSPQNTLPMLRSAVTVKLLADGRKAAIVGMRSLAEVEEWQEGDPEIRRFDETKIYIGEDTTGQALDPPPWPFAPHGWRYRPEDVAAIVLRKVQREVEAAGGPAMHRVVVTHPQYFTEARRKATRQAVEIAGLELVDTLTEPDAAAVVYGLDAQPGRYMIFDLGGGTLDVTVVEIAARRQHVLASNGDKVGGRDFDRVIFQRMVEEYQALYPSFDRSFLDERTTQVWMREAERLKRQLNAPDQPVGRVRYSCQTPQFPDGQVKSLNIKREQFIADARPLVSRCIQVAEAALEAAHLGWSSLQAVVCVGGGTRLGCVQQPLADVSKKVVDVGFDVETAVAQGAAIHAHRTATRGAAIVDMSGPIGIGGTGTGGSHAARSAPPPSARNAAITADVEMIGALARGLGVRVYDRRQGRNVIMELVAKDTPLPHRAPPRAFRTVEQDRLEVELYEGEDADPDACEYLGRVDFAGVALGPPGQRVEVTLEIDANGAKHLVVEALGQRREAVIRYDPKVVLGDDDVAARRAFVAALVVV